MAHDNVLEFTDDNFNREVLSSDRPVLVDFHADWCQPCRAQEPTISELAERYAGRATVGKVDIDANPELATRYGIRSIPTVLLFNDGHVAQKFVGITSKQDFEKALDETAVCACE